MQDYVLRLICAALAGGILLSLLQGAAAQKAVKLLWGIFMACCILSPIADVDLGKIFSETFLDTNGGAAFSELGMNIAREEMEQRIKQECEAYILDKAAAYTDTLSVEVTLSPDDPPVPRSAVLTGRASPYGRSQIEEILHTELGIPKENVEWTG